MNQCSVLVAGMFLAGVLSLDASTLAQPPSGRPATAAPAPQASADLLKAPGDQAETIWVSAKAAADPNRVLKWELFGETSQEGTLHSLIRSQTTTAGASRIADVAEIPESECATHTVSSIFSEAADKTTDSSDDLVTNSIGIYAGTITAINSGFTLEAPSELLIVKIQDSLRAAAGLPAPASSLYLLYGVAHFRIGGYTFCGLSNAWGEPRVGDRVLVFVYQWAQEGSPGFVLPVNSQLVFGTKKGLYLPPTLRKDPKLHSAAAFDEVVSTIRQQIVKGGDT